MKLPWKVWRSDEIKFGFADGITKQRILNEFIIDDWFLVMRFFAISYGFSVIFCGWLDILLGFFFGDPWWFTRDISPAIPSGFFTIFEGFFLYIRPAGRQPIIKHSFGDSWSFAGILPDSSQSTRVVILLARTYERCRRRIGGGTNHLSTNLPATPHISFYVSRLSKPKPYQTRLTYWLIEIRLQSNQSKFNRCPIQSASECNRTGKTNGSFHFIHFRNSSK